MTIDVLVIWSALAAQQVYLSGSTHLISSLMGSSQCLGRDSRSASSDCSFQTKASKPSSGIFQLDPRACRYLTRQHPCLRCRVVAYHLTTHSCMPEPRTAPFVSPLALPCHSRYEADCRLPEIPRVRCATSRMLRDSLRYRATSDAASVRQQGPNIEGQSTRI